MRIEKSSPIVITVLDDRTGVILNLETLEYYSLNPTGVAVWQQIDANKSITAEELVSATCARFEVDEDRARQTIGAFVEKLKRFKLIRAR